MMVYLASRYSRREELCGYREAIQRLGFSVQAEWLNGEHQISDHGTPIGESGEALVEGALRSGERLSEHEQSTRAAALRQKFARSDFRDVSMCNLLIAFTERPRSCASRGGRHCEMGIALGMMKRVWIVGPREHIFCWLDDVRQFDTWEECLAALEAEATP